MVHQLATHGVVADDKLNTMVHSLFVTNPGSTEEIYRSVSKLNLGIQVLLEFFQGDNEQFKSPEIMRYIFSILHLESKLNGNKTMLQEIGDGLDKISQGRPDTLELTSKETLSALSCLYQETLSKLSFRIQVKGDIALLNRDDISDKVRAILMSGVRSAVLWRQLGGRKWQLVLQRKKISSHLHQLMNKIHEYH